MSLESWAGIRPPGRRFPEKMYAASLFCVIMFLWCVVHACFFTSSFWQFTVFASGPTAVSGIVYAFAAYRFAVAGRRVSKKRERSLDLDEDDFDC